MSKFFFHIIHIFFIYPRLVYVCEKINICKYLININIIDFLIYYKLLNTIINQYLIKKFLILVIFISIAVIITSTITQQNNINNEFITKYCFSITFLTKDIPSVSAILLIITFHQLYSFIGHQSPDGT